MDGETIAVMYFLNRSNYTVDCPWLVKVQSVILGGHLLYAASLGDLGLLTVERRWVDVVRQLPPALMRDKYGT